MHPSFHMKIVFLWILYFLLYMLFSVCAELHMDLEFCFQNIYLLKIKIKTQMKFNPYTQYIFLVSNLTFMNCWSMKYLWLNDFKKEVPISAKKRHHKYLIDTQFRNVSFETKKVIFKLFLWFMKASQRFDGQFCRVALSLYSGSFPFVTHLYFLNHLWLDLIWINS